MAAVAIAMDTPQAVDDFLEPISAGIQEKLIVPAVVDLTAGTHHRQDQFLLGRHLPGPAQGLGLNTLLEGAQQGVDPVAVLAGD